MDLNAPLQRYLANPDVARWLFSTNEIKTVTAEALELCFVYAMGFNYREPGKPRDMHVEDMLILTGSSGTFLLGFLWGLSQPHIFARTPLMLDRHPIARRFAIDMSNLDALEFMEFVTFEDGKIVVAYRKFLHTHDDSLPVVVCATLHGPSNVEQTLGPILMRADAFEAASCPVCGQAGRKCLCTFDSYAPNTLVRKSTFNWNQFSSRFMNKARTGLIKLRITAFLPGVGEMCLLDGEIPTVNVLQKGSTEYLTLLRRKAVHGLGINVVMPRTDSLVASQSTENDFLDLHNSYVSRKRVRNLSDAEVFDFFSEFEDIPDAVETPTTMLEQVTSQMFGKTSSNPLPRSSITKPSEFVLSPILYTGRSPTNMDKAVEPLSLLPTGDTKVEAEPAFIESTFFGKGPPDAFALLPGPDFALTPPSTGQAGDLTGREADILQDIELILSPEGGLPPPDTQQDEIPAVDLLDNSTTVPAIHWTSSISSEDSASEPKQRKTATTKRAKRARAPVSKPQLSTQASSDSTNDVEKKHVCKVCTARFKMRGDLLRHVKTVHEGKKMYTCKTCGKAFGHSGHLNRHISSVHLQQRRFKCQYCGFQFFQASHLQSHIGHIHSAKKPFKCKFCGVRVNSEAALKNHMAKTKCAEAVTKEGIECSFNGCNSKFSSQTDLDDHNAFVHQTMAQVLAPGAQFQALPI